MRAEKGTDGIYDFDALVREPRLARVGGEIVDVSVIPVAVTLALAKRSDMTKEEMLEATKANPAEELRKVIQLVSDACVPSNPKLTVEFLMANLDQDRLNAFTRFVLNPVTEEAERLAAASVAPGDEGNAKTGEPQ